MCGEVNSTGRDCICPGVLCLVTIGVDGARALTKECLTFLQLFVVFAILIGEFFVGELVLRETWSI